MNGFNKTEAAVFSCRLCFLRAFPFISLIQKEKRPIDEEKSQLSAHNLSLSGRRTEPSASALTFGNWMHAPRRTLTPFHALRTRCTCCLVQSISPNSTSKSGYWQVELDEADKEKTAFQVWGVGFYEANRMPSGSVTPRQPSSALWSDVWASWTSKNVSST